MAIEIIKGLIGVLFALLGVAKIFLPKEKLLEKGMKGLQNLQEKQIKTAGSLELLGAIGLYLPSLLNIYPILSAISAFCLALTMVVAQGKRIKFRGFFRDIDRIEHIYCVFG